MKVLVDEMYPAAVAEALQAAGIEATTVAELRLAGASDPEVFGAAVAGGYSMLTENVGDFTRIAASTAPPAATTTGCSSPCRAASPGAQPVYSR